MSLLWIEYVAQNREAFAAKVLEIAKNLSIDPNWLMHVMKSESGLSHTIVNPMGGATGLIQFMPSTAATLGTTTQALQSMTNVEQLDYVYKYFKPWAGKIKNFVDLYMITFMPLFVGASPDTVIQTLQLPASVIAQYNPGFDINGDHKLTMAEVEQIMLKNVPAALLDSFKKKM